MFVIHPTQAREQLFAQRKLPEILAALPGASNAVIGLEDAAEDHLAAVNAGHRQLHRNLNGASPDAAAHS